MEDNENKKSEVEVDGLGLIEFASEDDSLLFSSFPDPTNYIFSDPDKDGKFFKDDEEDVLFSRNCDEELLVSSIEEKEEVLQPHKSPELEKEEVLQPHESPEPEKEEVLQPHESPELEKEEVLQPHKSPGPEKEEVLQPHESPELEKEEVLQPHKSPEPEKEEVLQPHKSPEPEKEEVLQPHQFPELVKEEGLQRHESPEPENEEVLQPHESPEPEKDEVLQPHKSPEPEKEEVLQPHESPEPEKEEMLQPHESPEPEKLVKSRKYNLRKSLAWDKAFFTSEGVLEPEELSSMMESNQKSERKGLPTIQEDINRSTDSISSFQSDCTVENSQEFVLFEDVRASIQRSSAKASNAATPGKSALVATEVVITQTTSTVDVLASKEKVKPKASPKKPSIRVQGLGKATKQPVATRALNTSISKPPSVVSRIRSLSTTSTNRASLDISKNKQENISRVPAGTQPMGPRISISRSARPILPKPAVLKSTLRSSAASKNELTSSCSSLESCASASSSTSHKSSLDSIKKKNDSSSRLASQSLANRSMSRGIMGQPRIPPQPINKISKPKLSSSVPTGSISNSSSRASATNKMTTCNQKTVIGEKGPANDNTVETEKPLKNSKDASVVQADAKESTKRTNGGMLPPTSMKASGLRVPSPKIGFFDGVRHGSSSSASKKKASSRLVPVTVSSPRQSNKLYSKINAEDQLEG